VHLFFSHFPVSQKKLSPNSSQVSIESPDFKDLYFVHFRFKQPLDEEHSKSNLHEDPSAFRPMQMFDEQKRPGLQFWLDLHFEPEGLPEHI
jgi:hypothetical protein